jgi:hypothetical protein
MLWIFPPDAPLTRANMLSAVRACDAYASKAEGDLRRHLKIGYLSCVPYVLGLLAGSADALNLDALDFLRRLDLLGVGGAALPRPMGDALVNQGVPLLSRYGSAECGFLMSSFRDFENDKEWEYLRNACGDEWLNFEEQEDGETAELVVMKGWPCLVSLFIIAIYAG